jgi:hypothetical protein
MAMKKKITIFGSCRQDSVYDIFDVTSIKNELSYPHYLKEIIECIEFCSKKDSDISDEMAKMIFRSGLLNCEIDREKIVKEFEITDVFLIEIASRIEYKYNGHYAHHIITNCNNLDVEIKCSSDNDISFDLNKLKFLLKKPFIVIGHIYTYERGNRYDLVQFLENECKNLNIPFINPAKQFKSMGYNLSDFVQKEDIIAHYNTEGHEIIKKVYEEMILDLLQ